MISRVLFIGLLLVLIAYPAEAKFFSPAGFNNGFMSAGAASIPVASSDWRFNDGSGATAIDSKGVTNLAITGSPTWGAGYMSIDGTAGANNFIAAGTNYSTDTTFSVVEWVYLNTTTASNLNIVGMGDGTTKSWQSWRQSTGRDRFTVNSFTQPTGFNINATTLYLIVNTFQTVDGAGNDIQQSYMTSDCSNWTSNTDPFASPISTNSGYKIRSMPTATNGVDARYYRLTYYSGVALSSAQMQLICNAGSEGTLP